jgi:hypothetical protein
MTEERRARRLADMRKRFVVHGSGPPTPHDLHERLGRAILAALAHDPEMLAELLETIAGATFGRHTTHNRKDT